MKKLKRSYAAVVLCLAALLAAACVEQSPETSNEAGPKKGKIRIGLSMDTLKEERWQRDRDLFMARARECARRCSSRRPTATTRVQNQQAENLLTQGVDVLVVVPHNGEIAASIVESAKAQGVPVIAYDRLIAAARPSSTSRSTRQGRRAAGAIPARARAEGQLRAHRRRAHRQQRAAGTQGADERPEAGRRPGRREGRRRPVGEGLAGERGANITENALTR